MQQRTSYTPPYSSNPSDLNLSWRDYCDEEEEFILEIFECDDFWWDEEERHELF